MKRSYRRSLSLFASLLTPIALWAAAPRAPKAPQPFSDTLVIELLPTGSPVTATPLTTVTEGESVELAVCANSCASPDTGNSSALTLASLDPGATLPSGAALTDGVYTGAATLITAGSQAVSAADADDTAASATVVVAPITGAVGAATPISFTVTVSAPESPSVQVLTQGAAGKDFTDADAGAGVTPAAGSCDAVGGAPVASVCTVHVNFTATAPGLRSGAVVISTYSGPAVTVYLSAVGQGSLLATSNNTLTSGLYNTGTDSPGSFAVDGAGDLFIADATNNRIYERANNGSSGYGGATMLPIVSGTAGWAAATMAVDGAGNVIVSENTCDDSGTDCAVAGIYRIPRLNSGSFGTVQTVLTAANANVSFFNGSAAVDGGGNIFIGAASGGVPELLEIPSSGASPFVVAVPPDDDPAQAVAIDPSGNLYLQTGYDIYKIAAGTWSSSAPATPVALVGGFNHEPFGLAVDAAGNVYWPDFNQTSGDFEVFELAAGAATGEQESSLTPILDLPQISYGNSPEFAMDTEGNFYTNMSPGDDANPNITKIDRQDLPSDAFGAVTTDTSTPLSVAVTNIGNAAAGSLAATVSDTTDFNLSSDTCTGESVASNASCGFTVNYAPPSDGSYTATVSLASNAFNSPQTGALSGSALGAISQLLVTAPGAVNAGGAFTVTVTAADADGNAITSYSGTVHFTSTDGSATLPADSTLTSGVGSFTATFNTAGVQTLTASDSADSLTGTATVQVVAPAVNGAVSGTLAGGGNTETVTFTFPSGATVGSVAVLTQGIANLDFTRDPSDTGATACKATTYAASATCTVLVDFNPKAPGLRTGAVVLYDTETPGVQLQTQYISGTGTGAQLAFVPASGAVATTLPFSGIGPSTAVAVDAAGDVFEADTTKGILELLPNGTTVTLPATAYTSDGIYGLALDGAGNLYFGDSAFAAVFVMYRQADGSFGNATEYASGPFESVYGLYVDGSGDVFVADPSGTVYEVSTSGGGGIYTVISISSDSTDVNEPLSITGDAAGNIYVGDDCDYCSGYSEVYQVAAGSWNSSGAATSAIDLADSHHNNLEAAAGVALDPHGDLFILDYGQGQILEVPQGASSGSLDYSIPVVVSNLNNEPYGIAADPAGNLYLANYGGNVQKFDFADVPSLAFGSVFEGVSATQTLQIVSTGNANATGLGLNITSASGFALAAGGGGCPASGGTLAPGNSCTASVVFTPTAVAPFSGVMTVVSNEGDASTVQPGFLTGTGTQPPAPTMLVVTATPGAVSQGGTATVTVTAEGSGGVLSSLDNDTVTLVTTDSAAVLPASITLVNGVGTAQVTFNSAGDQTVTAADATAGFTASALVEVQLAASSGTVGAASSGGQTVTFNFSASTTVGRVGVLTQAVSGLDFTRDANPGTCAATTYAAGASCTVNVDFAAKAPGLRTGAVVLYDASGNPLQTFPLSGTGSGSLLAVTGAAPTVVGFSGLDQPVTVAVDGGGDVFTTDLNNSVYELPRNGVQVTLVSGLNGAVYGLALDGAGNLYLAESEDYSSSAPGTVYRMQRLANGTYAAPVDIGGGYGWSDPSGIYVDASGNAFVTDDEILQVVEIPAGGGAPFEVYQDPTGDPFPITGDAAGNLYVANESGYIYEIQAGSWSASGPATATIALASTANGLVDPYGLALDPHGDLLISDYDLNEILLLPQGQTAATLADSSLRAVQSSGLDNPFAIAMDAAGNLYVANAGDNNVLEFDQADVPALSFSAAASGSAVTQTLGVTSIGTAAANNLAASLSGSAEFSDAASTCPTASAATLAAGAHCGIVVAFNPATAGVATGSLALASDEFDSATILPGALSGSATSGPATQLIFSPVLPGAQVAGAALTVSVAVTDATGDPFINTDQINLTVAGGGGSYTDSESVGANGVATFNVPGGTFANAGAYIFTAQDATESSLTAASGAVNVTAPSVAVGSSANSSVGGTALQTVTFNFSGSSTAVHSVAVLTQGTAHLDFARDASDTGATACTAESYSGGESCTVNVDFTPTAPGLRLGAVELLDSVGNVLQTAYLSRVASGPAVTYDIAAPAPITVSSGTTPVGLTVDAAGNVYIAQTNPSPAVVKITPNGTTTDLGSGWSSPAGVAVDGAGNVFVADHSNGTVTEVTPSGAQAVVVNFATSGVGPNALVVDGNGTLYVGDSGHPQTIWAFPSGCTSTTCATAVASGLSAAGIQGLARDAAGDLYYADLNSVQEQPAGGGSPLTIATGLAAPSGLALDAAGDLYVSDNSSSGPTAGAVAEITPAGTATTLYLPTVASSPGVAVDGFGNVYFSNGSGDVLELNRQNAAGASLSLTAPSVYGASSAPQTVTIGNAGNSPLSLALNLSTGLTQTSTGTGDCAASAGTVASGTRCALTFAFTGTSVGAVASDTIVATDNTLNASASPADQQTINVSGSTTPAPLTITASAASMNYGDASFPTFSATLSGAVNGDTLGTTLGATFVTSASLDSPPGDSYTITPTLTGANAGDYTVTPVNGTLTINPAPQTIAFSPALPSSVAYGATPLTLGATLGASGNPVTFAVTSGPGTISGGDVLSFTGAGAVVVNASEAGNSDYAATSVSGTITVTGEAQTINFTLASTALYGTTVALSATGGASGNPVTFAVTSGPGTISGSTLSFTGVGAVVVTANQAGSGGYDAATPRSKSITVTQASQAISFALPATAVYGTPVALSATGGASGNAVTFAVTSGPGTITGSSLSFTGVGAVVVTASQAASADYAAATPVAHTVTVSQASQAITFTLSTTAAYGTTVGLSATGGASGSPITFAVTSGPGAITGSTLSFSGVGAVVVTASQAASADYAAATPVSHTVTVSQASQTITFTLPATAAYNSTVALSATGGASGNAVTFAVTSGPGAISGSTLSFTGQGAVTVTASQAGSTDYAAATPVSQTITTSGSENPNLAFSLASSAVYGTTLPLSASSANSGSPITFAVTSGPGAISGSTLSFSGVGAVVVTASQAASGDYAAATPVSHTVTVSQASQAITFTLSTTAAYGTTVGLSATGGASGSPITFAVTSGPGAITGSTLSFSGVGAVVVTASQAASADYAAATPVSHTVTVSQASQTITFTLPATAAYNSTVGLSATGGGSGNAVTFAVTSGPGAISGSTLSFTGQGAVTVTASQAGSTDYAAATPVSQTITTSGSENPNLAFSLASSAVYGTTLPLSASSANSGSPIIFAVTSGPGAISGSTLSFSGVGAVVVTASQAASGDYAAATPVSHTVTVSQASQTITFAALANHATTDAPFGLSATASSGLAVTFSIVSGPATVTASTLTLSGAAGTVTVEASQAGNTDYAAATPVEQSFVVSAPGAVTVGVSASSLTFGSQAVGTSSAAETLILSAGSAPVTLASATASGDFQATTACAAIAAGATCAINIVFTPTATGARSGVLTITDSAAGSPQTVALAGTGVAAGASLSPSSLSFGAVPVASSSYAQSVTLENTASVDLHVSSIVASGDYTASGNCATVPAGASCSIAVTFTPTASGDRPGTLTVTDDAPSGTQTATLDGTGAAAGVEISPASLSFAPTVVGIASPAQTVTLTNSGASALTAIAIAAQGDFLQTNTCTSTLAAGASCAMQVTFSPTLAGAESGSIVITDSLGTQPVALSGAGLAPGANLSATQLTFGGELAGSTSAAQTVVLTNSGSSALAVTAITASAGFSETDNCVGSLAAQASCGMNVSFAPTAAGAQTGTVTVVDAAGSQTIAVAGQGTAPGLAITPSTAAFGAEIVGASSLAQTLTVTNTGTAAVSLNPVAASGDFTLLSQCPTTTALPPGSSCLVSATFAPTATGSRAGDVTVTDTTGAFTAAAALSGTGLAPGMTASPAELFFGSQTVGQASSAQTVTVTNSGTASLSVGAINAVGDFSEVNTCSAALTAGQSCIISVTMTPTTAGSRTGTLTIYDNANGSYPIALSGTGAVPGASLAPAQLDFGSQPIPGSVAVAPGAAQTVTLTNSGSAALTVGSILATGDFSVTNNCGAAVAAGASCSISVVFAPAVLGESTGELILSDSAGVQTAALAGEGSPNGVSLTPAAIVMQWNQVSNNNDLNVGPVQLLRKRARANDAGSATQSSTLTNSSGQAYTNLAITASGEFSETNNCGTSLAAGASCTLQITLTPLTTGAITGTISISDSGQTVGAAGSNLAEIALAGGGSPANLTVTPGTVAFSAEAVGVASAAQTVTISNTGTTALTTLAIASTPEFPLSSNTCAATLAGGASCTVAVSFQPAAVGNRTGALTLTAAGGISDQVALSGTAIPAGGALQVAPSSLSFAPQDVGLASAAQTVTVTNTGTAAIALASIAASAGFAQTNNCAASLAAGASCAVAVTFAPSATGAATGSLSVVSSVGTQTVLLGGSGVSYTMAAITPSANVDAGGAASFQLSFTPGSFTGAVSLACSGLPSAAACSFSPASLQLTAGAAATTDTLTITTGSRSGAIPPVAPAAPSSGPRPWLWASLGLLAALLLLTALLLRDDPRRRRNWAISALMLGALAAAGCGGATNLPDNSAGTPAGTYTITVTATAGAAQQTTTVTLSVN